MLIRSEILGLPAGTVLPRDDDESLPEYVSRWNGEAEKAATELRLFDVAHYSDYVIVLCMEPEGLAALQAAEYLAVWAE